VVKLITVGLAVVVWLVGPALEAEQPGVMPDIETEVLTARGRMSNNKALTASEKAVLLQSGKKSFSIGNETISVDLEDESWAVKSLIDRREGINFAVPAENAKDRVLWELAFRANKGLGKTITVNSRSRPRDVKVKRRGRLCVKTWKGLDINDEKAVLDVAVRIEAGSGAARMWISVTNRSKKYGLGNIVFPIVHLRPTNCDTERYYCVLPWRTGKLEEAFPGFVSVHGKNAAEIDEDAAAGAISGEDRVIKRYNLYPSSGMQMQFNAVYGEKGNGLYLAAHDPGGNMKWFNLDSDMANRTILFKVTHFPDDEWYPDRRFVMDYPVVMRFFEGDWYDAARLYRQWAIKQPWCRLGPVAIRKDVPEWVKRGYIALKNDYNAFNRKLSNNRLNSERTAKAFDTGLIGIWYQWWKGQSENVPGDTKKISASWGRIFEATDGLKEAVADIQKHGGRLFGYYNIRCYDLLEGKADEDLKLAEPSMARALDGSIQYYSQKLNVREMCFGSEWWQDRVTKMAEYIVGDIGFNGVYLDSFGRNGRMCYDVSHGHSHGGSKHFLVGEHRLGERVRKAIKKINPDAAISTEASVEYFIDVADLKLFHYNVIPDAIPLWTAVYHDFQVCYGRTISGADFTADSGKPFYMKVGNLFNMGAQVGRFFMPFDECFPLEKGDDEAFKFVKKVVDYKKLGHKYLTLGEMMRPPKITTQVPQVSTSARLRYPTTLPAVLSSAWGAEDGKIGVFFTNISDSTVEFKVELPVREYRYGANIEACLLNKISENGEMIFLKKFNSDLISLEVTVEPRDILFYELVFENRKQQKGDERR
jgi:Domain of unknown function (DUF6259)